MDFVITIAAYEAAMYEAWNILLNHELFKEFPGRIYIAEYTGDRHMITWKGC